MGMQSVIIKDETAGQNVINEFVLSFLQSRVTVADIIRQRVCHEVENYNRRTEERRYQGLIQPTDSEIELNGYKLKKGHRVNVEKQIEIALEAFDKNGFFMLIDDVQAENLNDTVALRDDMNIVFLKLTPLVGG